MFYRYNRNVKVEMSDGLPQIYKEVKKHPKQAKMNKNRLYFAEVTWN